MQSYIQSVQKQFTYYKSLGDKTFVQIDDAEIHWQFNDDSNSIAIITKHIVGNMLSRWTNFYTEDGEKEWRKRDTEFEDTYTSKEEMVKAWNRGWDCLFNVTSVLKADDLQKIVYIRNEGHTVVEAINRQLCHYAFHTGQLVYIGKMLRGNDWKSLSIPKNKSSEYNKKKFCKDRQRGHFTDDL